nr:MAG TPA: hypothetical protein [Caudoviricetes sp.]
MSVSVAMFSVAVIVLSFLSRLGGLSSPPMTQSCSLACCGSTHMDGDLPHKTVVWGILTDTGCVCYTRTHVPICTEKTLRRP